MLQESMEPSDNGLYLCPECPEEFPTELDLKLHLKERKSTVDPNGAFPCEYCFKTFVCLYGQREHTCSYKSSPNFQKFNALKNIPCPECSEMFLLEHDLKRHLKGKREAIAINGNYPCNYCGERFVYEYGQRNHRCPFKIICKACNASHYPGYCLYIYLECVRCDRKFKFLKDNVVETEEYLCKTCSELFSKNSNERCSLCSKVIKFNDFRNIESNLKCTQCRNAEQSTEPIWNSEGSWTERLESNGIDRRKYSKSSLKMLCDDADVSDSESGSSIRSASPESSINDGERTERRTVISDVEEDSEARTDDDDESKEEFVTSDSDETSLQSAPDSSSDIEYQIQSQDEVTPLRKSSRLLNKKIKRKSLDHETSVFTEEAMDTSKRKKSM